jgi:hypothetical protein
LFSCFNHLLLLHSDVFPIIAFHFLKKTGYSVPLGKVFLFNKGKAGLQLRQTLMRPSCTRLTCAPKSVSLSLSKNI